jgi:hypothetical protein
MVTPGFLPFRDTRKSLYIVGEGREQDAEASPARLFMVMSRIAPGTALLHQDYWGAILETVGEILVSAVADRSKIAEIGELTHEK